MTTVRKAILITVSTLVILAIIILAILWAILSGGYTPGEETMNHEYLQTVIGDDMVYLSDDFLTSNSLEYQTLEITDTIGACDVNISYNRRKYEVPRYPTERVKGIDDYSYILKSVEDYDGIPVTVGVSARTGNDRANVKKYTNEYGGYKYRYLLSSYGEHVYFVKTSPKYFKSCIFSISIKIENDGSYTDEQVKAREEEIFKSAVDNIIKYQG